MSRRKGKSSLAKRVKASWDAIEENEPDISTERLIAMVADDCGVDYGAVVDVLAEQAGLVS